ncbi:MAG: hypothetical protein KF889_19810 [Alphaproteobacteria bacterium]|nr:hypothetical protein [Alphaproteobacteria bacterium]MCW5744306.1 hypothetical protein [Alphaproteobacteria bacterium]
MQRGPFSTMASAAFAAAVLCACDGEEPAAAPLPAESSSGPIGADRRVAAKGIAVDRSRARYDSDLAARDETRGLNIGAFVVSPSPDQRRPEPPERPPVPEPIAPSAAQPSPGLFSRLFGPSRD